MRLARLLPLGAALGLATCGAAPEAAPRMRTILVTGFGPFLQVTENPSWTAIRDWDGTTVGRSRIAVARLDVTYADAPRQLSAALERVRPDVVLCLGVAGDAAIRLESTARNADTAASPDTAGEVRHNRAIREGGPATLTSRLPLSEIGAALREEGFEVLESNDAGGYLCNHVFYELLTRRPQGVAGFVHVPPLEGAWDLPRLQRALRSILAVLDASPP